MAKGELDASLVWATAIAVARREYPKVTFRMVDGYVPEAEQRWNLNFVVRKQDKALIEFINDGIAELLSNGRMKQIVESYGVPFYPPFS
jgi:ABC-type amino acid transport substrate-binding protein